MGCQDRVLERVREGAGAQGQVDDVGDRAREHLLRRKVGSGSRSHCLSGDCERSISISSTVAGSSL